MKLNPFFSGLCLKINQLQINALHQPIIIEFSFLIALTSLTLRISIFNRKKERKDKNEQAH